MKYVSTVLIVIHLVASSFINAAVIPKSFTKWSQKEISVCWWSSGMEISKDFQKGSPLFFNLFNKEHMEISFKKQDEKQRIKNVIQDHYNKETVSLDFIGWEECSEDSNSDLQIIALSEMKYTIKTQMTPDDLKYFNWIRSRDFNRAQIDKQSHGNFMVFLGSGEDQHFKDFNLETIALHEFGHLMGLRHEHFRNEASQDPACKHDPELRKKVEKGNPRHKHDWKKRILLTKYDERSIMNECHTINYTFLKRLKLAGINTRKTERFQKIYDQRFANDEIRPSKLDLESLRSILKSE